MYNTDSEKDRLGGYKSSTSKKLLNNSDSSSRPNSARGAWPQEGVSLYNNDLFHDDGPTTSTAQNVIRTSQKSGLAAKREERLRAAIAEPQVGQKANGNLSADISLLSIDHGASLSSGLGDSATNSVDNTSSQNATAAKAALRGLQLVYDPNEGKEDFAPVRPVSQTSTQKLSPPPGSFPQQAYGPLPPKQQHPSRAPLTAGGRGQTNNTNNNMLNADSEYDEEEEGGDRFGSHNNSFKGRNNQGNNNYDYNNNTNNYNENYENNNNVYPNNNNPQSQNQHPQYNNFNHPHPRHNENTALIGTGPSSARTYQDGSDIVSPRMAAGGNGSSGGGAGGDGSSSMPVPRPIPNLNASNMAEFLSSPGSRVGPTMCYIMRDRESGSKSYPKYLLFLEDNRRFLLSARKRKNKGTSNYVVSLDMSDLDREGESFFGKVRANFVGTDFTIYDNGEKNGSWGGGGKGSGGGGMGGGKGADSSNSNQYDSDSNGPADGGGVRQELGCISYQYNVLGTRGPRKMVAAIPAVDASGRKMYSPVNETDTILDRIKQGRNLQEILMLRNKPPRWNEDLGAYCLNFNGRVTEASVKNFQLVATDNLNYVVLQFGKVGENTFTMDYQWPMSAFQAFCICISSFDNKLACE